MRVFLKRKRQVEADEVGVVETQLPGNCRGQPQFPFELHWPHAQAGSKPKRILAIAVDIFRLNHDVKPFGDWNFNPHEVVECCGFEKRGHFDEQTHVSVELSLKTEIQEPLTAVD